MRYLTIHGHFYQPPRENPWLEAIEIQDSAYPYHDWNERITAECYAPNAAARILDGDGKIEKIVNNYARISFNFGPTVLSWAKDKAPGLHRMIVDADETSRQWFGGHGSALAQAYNHMIMPLANTRDKHTQVIWGIQDFKHRFGREPEGMWLPETAVDLGSLDALAEHGIKFTILAPHQAKLTRSAGSGEWIDVSGGRIDPTRPYLVTTTAGRKITVFFYDGPISRAVAFEGMLNNGEFFAERLLGGYSDARNWDELAHIATDGESYGHHHRYGEMALAYALDHIEQKGLATIANYGLYLEKCPPSNEAEIFESSAWSCAHGVGRWMSDCGCNSGGNKGWNQSWRAPLREALDWLRDEIAPRYEAAAAEIVSDPWAARNDYITVVLDRSPDCRSEFLSRHALRETSPEDQIRLWKLLEMQRHAMLMYTSCGWFFDDISGIETVQVIQYAGRVVQLAEELFASDFEPAFLEKLSRAISNVREHENGARIYEKLVKPTMLDLKKVGAHYAISSLFQNYPDQARIYCYTITRQDVRSSDAGIFRLLAGRARVTSEITGESEDLFFGALRFADHNITAGIGEYESEQAYQGFVAEAMMTFSGTYIADSIRLLDRTFGDQIYSLRSLFKDEQRNVLDRILDSAVGEAESAYRQLHERHAPLMRFLEDLGTPLPNAFKATAQHALNSLLRLEFQAETLDVVRIQGLLDEARLAGVQLDDTTLEFELRKTIERLAEAWGAEPDSLQRVALVEDGVTLARSLPFPVNLWIVQNICYDVLQSRYPQMKERAEAENSEAAGWLVQFEKLAAALSLRI